MPAGERRECSRVLVLDNDLGTAELAGSIAKSLGCEVSTSTDPKDALALARAASPDLVVLDSAFPGASGEDFARQLRAAGVAAPLVVMTASPRAAEVASQMGASRLVVKPFDLRDLEAALMAVLALHRARKSHSKGWP